ncbi:transcriptional regulator, GntR family [Devosia sp. YR412]|uniref:GntR family transcriptional regulator n=1 Tax=Devosia sp. YR412 TaxID=1881030 RepID=UPI0008D52088|nr:GntR family transcriptional regulator [Devosia sp. YR412]SEP60756.1 transcriptional regulator, GntR family [Devosia sp. YR412]
MDDFHTSQPIFVQIRQRLTEMILRGSVAEGEALPSVRQIAADLSVNPLTVTKAFEALVDVGVVEKRRGLGMFVKTGARAELLAFERDKFLKEEWPRIAAQIKALNLDIKTLLAPAGQGEIQ